MKSLNPIVAVFSILYITTYAAEVIPTDNINSRNGYKVADRLLKLYQYQLKDASKYVEKTKYEKVDWDGCRFEDAMLRGSGIITSPFYPNNYPSNAVCSWKITAPQSQKIYLEFHSFETEEENNCMFDGVELYDGGSVNSPYLGSICGDQIPSPMTSSGSQLYLVFYSDRNAQYKGFRATYKVLENDDSLSCGLQLETPVLRRIIGGEVSIPHSWPWQVSVHIHGVLTCGGTVITKNWILTAAHCVVKNNRTVNLDSIQVVVGNHDRFFNDIGEKVLNVLQMIRPDTYRKPGALLGSDIALLKVKTLEFNKYIQPACLPESDFTNDDTPICVATGWGETQGTSNNRYLNQVLLPAIPTAICSKPQYYGSRIKEDMFCAGYKEGGRDTCRKDSGGPLLCKMPSSDRWVVQGVVSWGHGCAIQHKPSVLTKVSFYKTWILENIKKPKTDEEIIDEIPKQVETDLTQAEVTEESVIDNKRTQNVPQEDQDTSQSETSSRKVKRVLLNIFREMAFDRRM